jgi:diguanylate cyclase (GGDEF)-like protein/PAS domain S-box-containing protein
MQEISILRMPVGIFKINSNMELVYANQYFCKITGYSKIKLLGDGWLNIIHPDDQTTLINTLTKYMGLGNPYKFEFRFTHAKKGENWVLCNLVPENYKQAGDSYIGTITDITELKQTQASLQELVRFDPLTELPNRYLFEDLLIKSLARAKRNKHKLALFYIDIDYFKNVNDFFGHEIGDKFLKEVSKRLKQSVRIEDFIVRLGGDEFAIILEDIQDINHISIAAQRLITDFNKAFIIGEHEIVSSLSIGISVYPDEKTTSKTIVQHADQALYQAKGSGRNCFKYYNKTMQHKLERYMLLVEQLRHAISENQFELYYQPKINSLDNSLVGVEALIRWHNPLVKNASPAEFIPIAEETGLMNQIGDWIISTALHQYKKWYDSMHQMNNVVISINISPSQLNDSNIIGTITNVLKETNIPTQNILFELTETAVMKKSFDTTSVLQVFLMELGIGISIDDFGTGYSSLTYLKQLPIKELKIDKSFIDDIGKNTSSEVIIKAIINLAITLDLEVIAEGVETKEQLEFLQKNQCTIIQGYYFSKPLNATEITAYIASLDFGHPPI